MPVSDWSPANPTDRKRHALDLFSGLPRHYDRVAALFSLGQDPRWRRAAVEAVEARPDERVLDVATGTGMVAQALVRRYGCTVVGLDQSERMLESARARLERDPALARQVSLVTGEAERLPFANREFDHLTFTYLLRYVDDPAATLRELARVVRPGGRVSSLEFAVPRSRFWRFSWSLYTRVGLPALGRLVSKEWRETGSFLARNIPSFYAKHPLEQQLQFWFAAGIRSIHVRRMSLGGGVVIWGTRGDDDAEST
jgi:demethylmenaquinone methyltransferase / 2-methoxy-6-polyprenyl-1,4-benzoquinol methylase